MRKKRLPKARFMCIWFLFEPVDVVPSAVMPDLSDFCSQKAIAWHAADAVDLAIPFAANFGIHVHTTMQALLK